MLDMDELVHEADCLAQALRELLSGTTHTGQEAQKYLVGELASRVSIIRKLWGNSLRPRAAAAHFIVLRADDVYKDTCTLCGKQNKGIRAIVRYGLDGRQEEERVCAACLFELCSFYPEDFARAKAAIARTKATSPRNLAIGRDKQRRPICADSAGRPNAPSTSASRP
jgi:hypothetical protein